MDFIIFISFFIVQRLSELFVAKRNEKWLRSQGAIEYGKQHYSLIILLHTFFIISMIVENFERTKSNLDALFLLLFVFLICLKIWVISSLGKYWNTKILRIPGSSPIRKGFYKFFKHPNYIIVVCEFIVIPMIFHLFTTAIIFSIFNAIILNIRIKEEDKVWNN